MKKITAILLAVIMVLLFAACTGKDDGKTTEVPSAQHTEDADNKDEKIPTAEEVAEANRISKLLESNSSIYSTNESDFVTLTECYFKYGSQIVRVTEDIYHDPEERIIVGTCGDIDFVRVDSERFALRAFVDEYGTEKEEDTLWLDELIAYPFINNNLKFSEETDEYYIFKNLEDDPEDEAFVDETYYVDKKTWKLEKSHAVNDDIVVDEDFIYNEYHELTEVMDDWNGELKTVTVVFETYRYGEPVTFTEKYELPVNWEVYPENNGYDGEPLAIYSDAGYTKEYTYPGDGIDHTIYVTTSVG